MAETKTSDKGKVGISAEQTIKKPAPKPDMAAVRRLKDLSRLLQVQEYASNYGISIKTKVNPKAEDDLGITLSEVIGDYDDELGITWIYGIPQSMQERVEALFANSSVAFHSLNNSGVVIPMTPEQKEVIMAFQPMFEIDPDDAKYGKLLGTLFLQGYDGIQDAIKAVKAFEKEFLS